MLAPPLLVRPGYADLIRNTPGLVAYWRMRDLASSTVFRNELTTVGATMTGTPTPYQGLPVADGAGAKFNGTSQALSAAINLSAYSTLSLSCWLWIDTGAANDSIPFEYTAGGGAATGALTVDAKESSKGGFSTGIQTTTGGIRYWWDYFTRPSADAWHHYLFTYDRATPVNTAYVDGVAVSLTLGAHTAGTYGNFANSTLNFMARNHASLWTAGRLAEVAMSGGVILTANDARNQYQMGIGW